MRGKKIALAGCLAAVGLVLGYVETLLPVFVFVPGMKLGLGNVTVLIALYLLGAGPALALNLVRVGLSALLFGNMMALWYSLAGGVLSWAVMSLLKKARFSCLPVSMAGAVSHNVGQILVAIAVTETWQVGYYLAVLWVTGLVTGTLIGAAAYECMKRIPKMEQMI